MILGGLCRMIYQGLRGMYVWYVEVIAPGGLWANWPDVVAKQKKKNSRSVAIEPTDLMWSQNKTTESLCLVVAVERTTKWYTANKALHNHSTNSVLDNRSTNKYLARSDRQQNTLWDAALQFSLRTTKFRNRTIVCWSDNYGSVTCTGHWAVH